MKILHSFPRGIKIWWAEKLLLDWQWMSKHKHCIFTPYIADELYGNIHEHSQICLWNTRNELMSTIKSNDPEIIVQHWSFCDLSDSPIPEYRYLHVQEGAYTFFSGYEEKERNIISSCAFEGIQWKIRKNILLKLWIDLPEYQSRKSINYKNPTFGILGRVNSQKIPEEFIDEFNCFFKNKIHIKIYWKIEDNVWNISHRNWIDYIQKKNNAREYWGNYTPNDLWKIFKKLDAIIVPSLFETWSYVALEAQGYWVPVFWLNNWWLPGHVYYKEHLSWNYRDLCARIDKFLHIQESIDINLMRKYIVAEHNKANQLMRLDEIVEE